MIAWLARRVRHKLRPGWCGWCSATVSSGCATYPFCSTACQEADWQSMSVY